VPQWRRTTPRRKVLSIYGPHQREKGRKCVISSPPLRLRSDWTELGPVPLELLVWPKSRLAMCAAWLSVRPPRILKREVHQCYHLG
jgi:hypothetical protein